jgi:hypothetical protein
MVYERYYHIYKEGGLIKEINKLEPRFTIIGSGWQEGNWYVVVSK